MSKPPQCVAASNPVCSPALDDAGAFALVKKTCFRCHDSGGTAGYDMPDVAAMVELRPKILIQLATCQMPPDGVVIDEAERRMLIGWAACTSTP